MDQHDLDRNTNLDNIVLALLFAADEPLSLRRLTAILEDVPTDEIRESLHSWRRRFDDEAWSIAVEQVAGGYQVITRPDYAPFVGRLYSKRRKLRLSRAGLETLAIIAYRQPVTRADIESVRGVSSGSVIANLMERSLIKITGKARVLGAPFLYGTTPEFLEYLGLNSLGDLPSLEELEALLEKEVGPKSEAAGEDQPVPVGPPPPADEAEDADELYEATAAEVAAAMAAVNEAGRQARQSIPHREDDDEHASEHDPNAGSETRDGGAASAARLGPAVEEPFNRPLETEAGNEDDAEAPDSDQRSVTADEREDER
jgi:segregation and condensation protein B